MADLSRQFSNSRIDARLLGSASGSGSTLDCIPSTGVLNREKVRIIGGLPLQKTNIFDHRQHPRTEEDKHKEGFLKEVVTRSRYPG